VCKRIEPLWTERIRLIYSKQLDIKKREQSEKLLEETAQYLGYFVK